MAHLGLADRLILARNGGLRVPPADVSDSVASACDAYAIQRHVADAVGPVGGFKTGRRPGQDQIMAPIFQKDVRASPAVFTRTDIDRIGIELEVGFIVDRPLPDPESAEFERQARDCVSAVAALEIVDTRLTDIETAPPLLRLADNQLNGAVVIGASRADWQALDLTTVSARLNLGSHTVLDGSAHVPGGDAFATFCALARMIGSHCGGLSPGQVVITGSLNGMPFIERGTPVRGWIDGFGDVAADFPT
ncbi:fumarylacetoacetate hydrolase family protein [Aurantimonas sp. A3-2-R12]|uniref:fumarylacetoacetate hydrolase family protein n=1 Tax=Aurantimonas sp. A3-2-R12 TaxID=3114362 RepID=UPI002E198EA7|nr:fumarylacetoacetate hydrolase family protein [Aurantimonas sp. A3-2-R12]